MAETTTGEKRDTVVLGASAGGIEALRRLLPAFEAGTDASVFVVQHLQADGKSVLDAVLSRATPYRVGFARDGEAIVPRRVYLAPPDHHLLVDADNVRLMRGARENRSRPAIDPLFRSAAASRRGRVLACVLSGLLDDGTAGLVAVKRCGGLAFVQSAVDAIEPEMPQSAAAALGEDIDGVLTADELGRHLASLVGTSAPAAEVPEDIQLERRMMLGEVDSLEALSQRGPPVPMSCPECGGPLWALFDGRLARFRCHTGHAYTAESLLSAQAQQVEQALWAAIKGLEQRGQMLTNFAREEGSRFRATIKQRYEEEASQLRAHAQTLRDVLMASHRTRLAE